MSVDVTMQSRAIKEAEKLDRKLHETYEGITQVRESLRQRDAPNASAAHDSSSEDIMISESVDVFQRLLNSGLTVEQKMAEKRKDLEAEFRPEISRRSQKIKRKECVEDHLLKMQNAYNAKMEQKRREKENQEVSHLRSPSINPASASLHRREPAHDRLYDTYKQLTAKKQLKKEELQRKELEEHRGKPEINRVSKRLDRSVEQIYAWQEQKEQNQQRLKQQLEERERMKCRGVKINRRSRELAERMGRKERVEDHLLYLHNRSMQRRELQQTLLEEQEQLMSTPRINRNFPTNSRMQSDVADRLYAAALESAEKKKNLAQEYRDSVDSVDIETGERLFQPNINPKSSKIKRNIPVQELLYQIGKEREAKRQEIEQERWKSFEHNKLKIGPVSTLLAHIVEEKTRVSSKDRIYQPIHQLKGTTQKDLEESKRKTMTFSPSLNENSVAIDKQVNKVSDRTVFLSKKAEEYDRNRQRLQKEREQNELAKCTFTPNPDKPRTPSRLSLLERNKQWLKKVNERMEKERQMAEAKQLQECTFKPNSSRKLNNTFGGRARSRSPLPSHGEGKELKRSFTPPPRRPDNPEPPAMHTRVSSFSDERLRSKTPPPQRRPQSELSLRATSSRSTPTRQQRSLFNQSDDRQLAAMMRERERQEQRRMKRQEDLPMQEELWNNSTLVSPLKKEKSDNFISNNFSPETGNLLKQLIDKFPSQLHEGSDSGNLFSPAELY